MAHNPNYILIEVCQIHTNSNGETEGCYRAGVIYGNDTFSHYRRGLITLKPCYQKDQMEILKNLNNELGYSCTLDEGDKIIEKYKSKYE